MTMINDYVFVPWPEVQELMEREEFDEHSVLANDERILSEYGGQCFFVERQWFENTKTYVLETGCGSRWYPADVCDNLNDAIEKRDYLMKAVCPKVRIKVYDTGLGEVLP